ncbi:MAG TPA: hypothetical protein VE662_05600 [Solirubrobacterales bacterium]|jgi:hypothetical protein|nr:hypothetical protein [Solirubrobacterales bacterium]
MFRRFGYRRSPLVATGPATGTGTTARYGLGALGGIVMLAGSIVAALIVIGILLVVLKANPHNTVVKDVHDLARTLAGPFDGLFKIHDHKLGVAVNWGLAAVVYFALSRLIAGFLGRR